MGMIPFSFQRSYKIDCEDAGPVAEERYSAVCDGVGGSGCTKYTVFDEKSGERVSRTSAYLGSRIVRDCVKDYYERNHQKLFELWSQNCGRQEGKDAIEEKLRELMECICSKFEERMKEWKITPSQTKTFKTFPTTLASAMYYRHPESNKVIILAVWAGDSRVYILTPGKGLQLLSVDDALDAENEMSSTSEMNNCIYANGEFHLNYAFYNLDSPGIVFCCTDGCFDYLRSPLHLEWLLLHTISECGKDAIGEEFGCVLENSIKDTVYRSIYDDTTMSGVIVGINSVHEMQELYKSRQAEHASKAEAMNELLEKLGKIKSERDNVRKKYALLSEEDILHEKVCATLVAFQSGRELSSEMSTLLRKLQGMPSYKKYEEKSRKAEEEIRKERESENREGDNRMRFFCSMLACDAVRHMHDEFEKTKYKWQETRLETLKKFIKEEGSMEKIHNHPWFKEASGFKFSDNEIKQPSQMREQIIEKVSNDKDSRYVDCLWQVYYLNEHWKEAREQNFQENEKDIERALKESGSYPLFASQLTKEKLKEYHEQKNKREIAASEKKCKEEEQGRIASIVEDYWQEYKNEIVEEFAYDSTILSPDYRDRKNQFNKEIEETQASINEIWEKYRIEYQLFRMISDSEKGVCGWKRYTDIL